MDSDLQLNVPLLRRRVPNLTKAATAVGLRPATVSNLCTGKIPIGRAEVKTLVALASLAGCSLDELVIQGSRLGTIETGIKALDLFAPIVRGSITGLVARPGVGQLALLSELMCRMKRQGFATVFWMPSRESIGVEDVALEAEITCNSLEEVYEQIVASRIERDVVLGADRSVVLSGEWLSLRERLQESGARPVTVFLVDVLGESVDEAVPYGPLDTLIRFDVDMVTRNLFPAIDPIASTSTILEGVQIEAIHLRVQQRARKVLRRYLELRSLAGIKGLEKLIQQELSIFQRGERLEAFLTQPLYVAEPFTKKKGEWVAFRDTVDDVRKILDGATDHVEALQLRYVGHLNMNKGSDGHFPSRNENS